YLNQDWRDADGGELRLYLEREPLTRHVDIRPDGGTLVLFLSEKFPHEVLPAKRERHSLTGWFKARG
ncbi:MAG TPA: 2OG-Fe(II) oxygenase, partial [Burkholderiales bacterium]